MKIAWESTGRGHAAAPDPRARLHAPGLGAARPGRSPPVTGWSRSTTGGSARATTRQARTRVEQLAGDAVQVLDEADVDRAHVLGASLGGFVAQELAADRADRVDRLVLACTSPGGPGAYPLPEQTLRLMAEAPSLAPEVALRRFVENALGERSAGRARRRDLRLPSRESARPGRLGGAGGRRAWDSRDVDARIAAPTLVLAGTADNVVDHRNAELLADADPRRAARADRRRRAPALLGAAGGVRQDRRKSSSDERAHDRPDPPRPRPDHARPRRDRRRRPHLDLRRARRRSDELARGLSHGDRVSTLTGNTAEHVALFFACAKAGAILHPISWRLAPAEVAFQLDDAEPAVFLVEDEHRAARRGGARARARPARRSTLAGSRGASGRPPADDDPLLLIYTRGTTGKPKGALLTHANCFWTNLSFDLATGHRARRRRAAGAAAVPLRRLERAVAARLVEGRAVVLERGFDAARALELIERERITTMMGVPANYLFMSQEPRFADADLASLRLAVVGGAPMPVALLDVWAERGVEIVQGYGLTEAAPNVLCLPPEDARRKAGSAGKPYPYVDCELSAEGELLVRGPNVFPGYWRNPEATARAFRDGWLLTGDIAERDDEGDYWIRGRLKDMVVSGGENVYPAEIEAVLHEHPAVVEAAVVGVPDERWGEVCAAFVVAGRPCPTTSCASSAVTRLARFKVPKSFTFVDALPRNSIGKVQKDELGGARMTEIVTSVDGRPLSRAGSTRGGACSTRPRRSSASSGTPTPRSSSSPRPPGVATGHVLPLLRLEEGDLRRARARPEQPGPPRDEGGRRATGRRASSRSCSASRRTSASRPSIRRSTGSSGRPSSSRRRCSATTTTASPGLRRRRSRRRSSPARSAPIDPEVTAWALMGLGELIGMRWILWGDGTPMPERVSDELARIIRCILEAEGVRRVGLHATASYLPERWLTAAEIASALGHPRAGASSRSSACAASTSRRPTST